MKANELRIGNWIEWDDDSHEQFQVENITFHEFEESGDEKIYFVNGGLFDDMLPIPLTTEWLTKFGFEKNNGIWSKQSLQVYQQLPLRLFWYNEDFVVELKSILYVHQLQNLYFALTGEELTIKE